jgi:signal transduction histidine kinase
MLRNELVSIRAQVGNARRATRSMKLYADMDEGRNLRPVLSKTNLQTLLAIIQAAATDHQMASHASRTLSFVVEHNGAFASSSVMIDKALFEQALGNLLDNAAKYSYPSTRIIVGVHAVDSRVWIAVKNTGIPLSSDDALKCRNRGWRGDGASVTGEGSGIGLWLADMIMRAHNGELEVFPTDSESKTEFRMVLHANMAG